jgi:hypothetical protein
LAAGVCAGALLAVCVVGLEEVSFVGSFVLGGARRAYR